MCYLYFIWLYFRLYMHHPLVLYCTALGCREVPRERLLEICENSIASSSCGGKQWICCFETHASKHRTSTNQWEWASWRRFKASESIVQTTHDIKKFIVGAQTHRAFAAPPLIFRSTLIGGYRLRPCRTWLKTVFSIRKGDSSRDTEGAFLNTLGKPLTIIIGEM